MKCGRSEGRLLLAALSFLGLASVPLHAQEPEYKVTENVVYYKNSDYELKLDIAYPVQGNPPFPAILYIFGGGWGYFPENRSQYRGAIRVAAKKGYVAVAIDYRLTSERERNRPKWQFPDQVHDVKNAVRWLRSNAEEYRIDPEHIGLVGWSSGAHLALMAGLTGTEDGLEGRVPKKAPSSKVKAIVSIGGPTEMTRLFNETKVPQQRIVDFLGDAPAKIPKIYNRASPVNYVNADDPVTLLVHGDRDTAVPFSQAQLMDQKMNAAGLDHTLVIKKDAGHANLFNEPEVWLFLEAHLKDK